MANFLLCLLVLASLSLVAQSNPQLSNLPLAGFEENKGQILNHQQQPATQVKFKFQNQNTTVFLLPTGLAYQFQQVHYPKDYVWNTKELTPEQLLHQQELEQQVQLETYRMDMELLNAHPNPTIITAGKSLGFSNYYNNNSLAVHSYDKITYKEVYPGIDWVIYTTEQGIKYDFVVAAGADPSQIQVKFKHQEKVQLQEDGSLILSNSMGQIQEQAPIAFQGEATIPAAFELKDNILQFSIGAYDKSKQLVIDPSVTWATYYGTNQDDRAYATVIDNQGFVYMAGITRSSSNFAQAGHQLSYRGSGDAFLAKFSSSGARQWVTYYGGTGADIGTACAVDNANNVYLAGNTISTSNISTTGSHQELIGNASFTSGFLVKFQPNGTRLWGTYYSGGLTTTDACATDGLGNVYLAGYTRTSGTASSRIITTGAHQSINRGNDDAYLVKFNSNGVRQWGTFYGGADTDRAWSCATDAQNNVYIAGQSASAGNLAQTNGNIAQGGHQNTFGGNQDAFLAKFNTNGTRQWGTYYGGTSSEVGHSCAVDGLGNVYLTGSTISSNAIATTGAHQTSKSGSVDAFLVKFNSNGNRQWGTYYGSSSAETALSCATDAQNNVYIAGNTESATNIATTGATYGGLRDGMLVQFNSNGVRQWGTYYGGTNYDDIAACAAGNNALYVVGETSSSTGIALMGFQNTFAGSRDAFLAAFRQSACVPSSDTIVQQACDSFSFQGQVYSNSGFYTDTLTNTSGCDSVVTLDLTINNSSTGVDVQTACDSYTWLDGNTYTSSNNTATFTLTNGAGCDSVVTLNLTINNSTTGVDVQTACDAYTWLDGNTYTSSNNTATFTLTNGAGCDSVVTLDLTINNSTTGVDIQTACDAYTWIDGNTYTSSNNTATFTLTNASGCDSVVTLDLTINNSTAGVDVQTACDAYTWIDGNTYTNSNNTATFTLTNGAGCDSVVTLNLTINNSTTGVDVQTACDSYTWLDGNTYTSSNNTATFTLTNGAGCDSVVTLDLTINNSTTGVDIQTACDAYTWIDGNTYTSSNNTATFTLTNASGCDSIVTLDLTINTVDVSTQTVGNSITANATGASYQWIDCDSNNVAIAGATSQSFTPTKDGNYAVIITQNGCTDTSNCVSFTGTSVQQLPQTALSIKLFPNPTTGRFALDLGDLEQAQVQIFAANGQLVQQQILQGQGIQELFLEGAAGVYFVQIQVGKQVQYSKLIKQ